MAAAHEREGPVVRLEHDEPRARARRSARRRRPACPRAGGSRPVAFAAGPGEDLQDFAALLHGDDEGAVRAGTSAHAEVGPEGLRRPGAAGSSSTRSARSPPRAPRGRSCSRHLVIGGSVSPGPVPRRAGSPSIRPTYATCSAKDAMAATWSRACRSRACSGSASTRKSGAPRVEEEDEGPRLGAQAEDGRERDGGAGGRDRERPSGAAPHGRAGRGRGAWSS